MKVSKDVASKTWIVQGTKYVVQSPKNKTIIGKLRGTKVIKLSEKEVEECNQKEWKVNKEVEEEEVEEEDVTDDDQ